jgi:outer membrane lipoprotein-sorting protein
VLVFRVCLVLAVVPLRAAAADLPTGEEIVRRVNARDDGHMVSRTLVMELVEPGGSTRTRVTRSFRRDFGDERRIVLFFEEPPNLKGTALLSWDHVDPARDDEQWLYLPDLRKSRRVAVSERGRSFLGSDLTFEEMKKETRLAVEDYRWRTVGEEQVDGRRCFAVEALPVDEETAEELGYGRVLVRIDAELWVPLKAEYWDLQGAPLKEIHLTDVRPVQGIWTPHRIEAENRRSGHRTRLEFTDVDYARKLPDDLFREGALARGAP